MFQLQDFSLSGASAAGAAVATERSPNVSAGTIVPKVLVFHYTACSYEAARQTFLAASGSNRVSAHLLVDTDGSVTQFVPFNMRAWHAGESFWAGLTDINTHSIGIEVVNHGYLLKRGDGTFTTSDGRIGVPPDQVVEAMHQNPSERHRFWHAYSAAQVETCIELAQLLVAGFGLRDIVGHDDIAPARKWDPLESTCRHASLSIL